MKKLIPVLVALILTGCNKQMIQLMKLNPVEKQFSLENKKYVFDNDTVRITYQFWSNHGKFEFSVENKLEIPIYIDWKKSNLIYNGTPNVYWVEETVVKSNSVSSGVGVRITSGLAYGASATSSESVVRPKERITFLPPASSIERNEYSIESAAYYLMDLEIEPEIVQNESNPKKETKVFTQTFDDSTSPIHLTNFLTFSTKESFENEWFLKNNFYLGEISEMELKHFRGKCTGRDENNVLICPRKLKSNTKYLLYVPKGYDFEKRKKRKMTEYVNPESSF
jgi:hypothetical protein